jgi:WD40 repeat protein
VVSASADHSLKVWHLAGGEIVASFSVDGGITCCAIAPDGINIVAGEEGGQMHFLRFEGNINALC